MVTSVVLYPSPMSNLTQALKALLRQPCGCFEQTSSSNYPLVLAQRYFKAYPSQAGGDIIAQANKYLAAGYKKLIGFECKNNG